MCIYIERIKSYKTFCSYVVLNDVICRKLIALISKWCSNLAVTDRICNPDLEPLCLTLRPNYLPWQFTNTFVCVVYIPPSGNATRVSDCVHLQNKPDAPMFILGDLKRCGLNKSLPGLCQFVQCSTRNNKTLDKCYGNIKGAYKARARPPHDKSDHNVIQLLPTYPSTFKSTGRKMPLNLGTLQGSGPL